MARVHNGEPKAVERSAEWLENRIEYLTGKKKSLKYDFDTRTKNVEEELAARKSELKALSAKKK